MQSFKESRVKLYFLNVQIDFRCPNGTQEEKEDPDIKCRPTLVNGNVTRLGRVCFGRGHCDCGECVCDSPRPGVIITGKFCQTVKNAKHLRILNFRIYDFPSPIFSASHPESKKKFTKKKFVDSEF